MLSLFKKTISLTNLDSGCFSGQIATILIFLMVIVLVMILVTINLGQVANFALDLSNAADSAILGITNSCATQAQLLWEGMGGQSKICALGGTFELLILLTTGPIGLAVVRGVYYGSFDAALSGFLDGLVFVVSIVGGFIAGGIIGAIVASVAVTYNFVMKSQEKIEALEEAAKQLNGLPQKDQITQTAVYTAFLNTVNDPNMIQDYFDSDANGDNQEMVPYFQFWWDRRINHLKKHYTSGIQPIIDAIQAFRATISQLDTSTTPPTLGILPYLEGATGITGALQKNGFFSRSEIENYDASIPGPEPDGALVALLRAIKSSSGEQYITFWSPGPNKNNYDCWTATHPPCPPCQEEDPANCPPPCCCMTCPGSTCPTCNKNFCSGGFSANCFDEVDKAIAGLTKLKNDLAGMRDKDISLLANSWEIWLPIFYDPDTTTNYYSSLKNLIATVGSVTIIPPPPETWQGKIEGKRVSLLVCKLGCGSPCKTGCATPTCVTNSPCRGPVGALPTSFGTINANLTDEFVDVQNKLTDLINKINTFSDACKKLYDDIRAALNSAEPDKSLNCSDMFDCPEWNWEYKDSGGATVASGQIDYGGDGKKQPAVYWWCDSTGYHEIRVQVNYTLPSIEVDNSFFQTCTYIAHGSGKPTVVITRLEPKSNVGILGPWNPLLGPTVPPRSVTGLTKTCSKLSTDPCQCNDTVNLFSITRTGKGYYNRKRSEIMNP